MSAEEGPSDAGLSSCAVAAVGVGWKESFVVAAGDDAELSSGLVAELESAAAAVVVAAAVVGKAAVVESELGAFGGFGFDAEISVSFVVVAAVAAVQVVDAVADGALESIVAALAHVVVAVVAALLDSGLE